LYARLARSGKIRVETLAQSGEWFRKHFSLTPPTSVVSLSDWKNENRKTVWYDSRFYRVNFLWDNDRFFIRDLHCFDENMPSPTHDTPLKATSLVYETLPVMDWANWSKTANEPVGIWPVSLSPDGDAKTMTFSGDPVVKEAGAGELEIEQPILGGGAISITCQEDELRFIALDSQRNPLRWALAFNGGDKSKSAVRSITPTAINFSHDGRDYELVLPHSGGTFDQPSSGKIEAVANGRGMLFLRFVVSTEGMKGK
jgi:hypothetical protein